MMHILLLLLKILGWILATILGLIVLLIFIALFIPVRYQVSGECKGTLDSLKGVICFTWLLHLVKGNIIYKNGKMVWAVRIAWKKIKTVPEELSETSHLDLAPEQETRPKEKQDNKTDSPQIKDNEGVYKKIVIMKTRLLFEIHCQKLLYLKNTRISLVNLVNYI